MPLASRSCCFSAPRAALIPSSGEAQRSPAVRRHFNAERRHWRHRGQIEARRAFSVTDGWKIKRAQCARFIFDIALQRSCLHCNFSATKRAFSRRSAPSCKKFSLEKIRKKHQNHTVLMLFGGDKRDRTADLLTASCP